MGYDFVLQGISPNHIGSYIMETIVTVLFIAFVFLVDWRLNKIYKELKTLNGTMASIKPDVQRD